MGYECRKINEDAWLIQGQGNESMYLIEGRDKALLIDAGMEKESLKEVTDSLTKKDVICVLTHGHFDHIGMCGEYDEVYLEEKDFDLYRQHSKGDMMPGMSFVCKDVNEVKPMKKEYDLGDHKIISIPLKGHTAGSVIFADMKDRCVYSGDAVGSGCGVLMTAGLGSLPLDQYKNGLHEAIRELEELGVDETWKFYGGHDGQEYMSRTGRYNPLTFKLVKDMEVLCEKMLDQTADITEKDIESPFGKAKEIFGTYGDAELQLLVQEVAL